eukprot:1156847-Pelagomonas_calceolata.AAC.2
MTSGGVPGPGLIASLIILVTHLDCWWHSVVAAAVWIGLAKSGSALSPGVCERRRKREGKGQRVGVCTDYD